MPTQSIVPDRTALARYGLSTDDVMRVVESLGGADVGEVFEGRARYPIRIRVPEAWRGQRDLLVTIPVTARDGSVITLGDVAHLVDEETPPSVEHERGRRRTYVQANVRGRDVASFVSEAQREVEKQIELPPGYELHWGGDFEHLQTASFRLAIITPIVLLMIFGLLHLTFKSLRLASMIFLAVPLATTGGILALALRGMPFSISAGVGFIALFGVAVLNGLVWVSAAENLRRDGLDAAKAATEAAVTRLRPILMTALVASLGFLPMAMSTTDGAEIQRPLASVVIGGLISATLLTSLVLPAIYPWVAKNLPVADE
ncbi:MAG: efflux RND transporter permease subunit [Pirellulaceae bacterium]